MKDDFNIKQCSESIEVIFTHVGEPGPEGPKGPQGPEGPRGGIGFVDFHVNDDMELIIVNESIANFHIEDGELLIDINL